MMVIMEERSFDGPSREQLCFLPLQMDGERLKFSKDKSVRVYTRKRKLISRVPCVSENRGCFAPRLDESRVLL